VTKISGREFAKLKLVGRKLWLATQPNAVIADFQSRRGSDGCVRRFTQNGHEPIYQRYHAEVFAGETLSCWEKHQMDQETARISRTALRAA
jgi:hypothetical protein